MHSTAAILMLLVSAEPPDAETEASPRPPLVEAVPSDAPRIEAFPGEARDVAIRLRTNLLAQHARLLEDRRPSFEAPRLLMIVSGVALAGTGALLAALRPWVQGSGGRWGTPVVALVAHLGLGIAGTIVLPFTIQARERADAKGTEIDGQLEELERKIDRGDLPAEGIDEMRRSSGVVQRQERSVLSARRVTLLEEQPAPGPARAMIVSGVGLVAASGIGWLVLGLATRGSLVILSAGVLAAFILTPVVWFVLGAAAVAGTVLTIFGAVRLEKYNRLVEERQSIDEQLVHLGDNDPPPRSTSPFPLSRGR